MSSYTDISGHRVDQNVANYHTIDPASHPDCLDDEAFSALLNDSSTCGNTPAVFNSGVYTVYNDPAATYSCLDTDGDGLDDNSGDDCNTVAQARPTGSKGKPGPHAGPGMRGGCGSGSPAWEVNMVNMNLFVTDSPLWYNPPFGPPVRVTLSYNSEGRVSPLSSFGNNWSFSYGGYLSPDPGGNVTVIMPDGREDIYTPDGAGGYNPPAGVFNSLTKHSGTHYELSMPDGTIYVFDTVTNMTPLSLSIGAIKDPYGQSLAISFTNGTITKITDASGRETHFTDPDGDGLIDAVNDPFGRSALFEYDSSGNLTAITDMGGYRTDITYDPRGYISAFGNGNAMWRFKIEPPDGNITDAASYPAPGASMGEHYRITVTDPEGAKEEFYYFGPYSWHVSAGEYIDYVSPYKNNLTSAGKTYYFLTGSRVTGKASKVLYPEGGYVIYDYDPSTGMLLRETDYHGNGISHSFSYSYNSSGRVSSVVDPKGSTTHYDYYGNGIDIKRISMDLASTAADDDITLMTFTYNGSTHDIASITNRMSIVTEFSYDSKGRLTHITKAKGTAVEAVRDYIYDPSSEELIEVRSNGSILETYSYDSKGRIRTRTDAAGITMAYDYNDLDGITRITYPDGRSTTYSYSTCCAGLTDSVTGRNGVTVNFIYDRMR
jgi:YD repeat-containing protein